jgi:hypothetical protein
MKIISILLLTTICMGGAAFAQAPGGGPGNRIERFRAALESLDLNSDQREKVNDLLQATGEKLKDLRNESDPAARQTKLRDAMQDLRAKLSDVLTSEQLQALRQKMQQSGAATDRNAPTTAPATQPAGMMMQEESANQPKAAVAKSGPAAATPIETGKAAPDFKLLEIDGGSPVQLSSLKGRVVVLIFGSYTCPTLRDRALGLDRLFHDVQGKASVFLVYTREAHPVDGWDIDRNKLDNIQIQQPTSEAARKSIARQAHDSLHLAMPILMDGMDDAVADAFGGFPNAAVVIGHDGVVFGTEQWAEPTSLRHMIDEAISEKTP